MPVIPENVQFVDVVCTITSTRKIIPYKFRVKDEDGEYQTYLIKGYKDISLRPNGNKNSVPINWKFECIIEVWGRERIVTLFYNPSDSQWRILN